MKLKKLLAHSLFSLGALASSPIFPDRFNAAEAQTGSLRSPGLLVELERGDYSSNIGYFEKGQPIATYRISNRSTATVTLNGITFDQLGDAIISNDDSATDVRMLRVTLHDGPYNVALFAECGSGKGLIQGTSCQAMSKLEYRSPITFSPGQTRTFTVHADVSGSPRSTGKTIDLLVRPTGFLYTSQPPGLPIVTLTQLRGKPLTILFRSSMLPAIKLDPTRLGELFGSALIPPGGVVKAGESYKAYMSMTNYGRANMSMTNYENPGMLAMLLFCGSNYRVDLTSPYQYSGQDLGESSRYLGPKRPTTESSHLVWVAPFGSHHPNCSSPNLRAAHVENYSFYPGVPPVIYALSEPFPIQME